MSKSKLDELAQELADHLLQTQEGPLAEISAELTRIAMVESGVRMDELTNDDMENSPIVRLYWAELSAAWAKVLTKVANMQHRQPSLED